MRMPDKIISRGLGLMLPLIGSPNLDGKQIRFVRGSWADSELFSSVASNFLYTILGMINTPRIFGRKSHMPHAGLQQKLVARKALIGKWPLQAWHEIVLDITPPKEHWAGTHESHLTGEKALHFVRKHLRLSFGTWHYVNSHWRGNGALGIKQARYAVVAPRTGRAMIRIGV